MTSKSSSLIWAGVATVGVLAGVTYALVQPAPQPSPEATSSTTPTTIQSSPAQPGSTPTSRSATRSVPNSTTSNNSTSAIAQAPDPPTDTSSTPTTKETVHRITKCVTSMAVVSDPNPPLNVRSSPIANADNVVGQLKNNTFVTIVNERDGWFQISAPTAGWISKDRTEHGCNQKVEEIQFATNATSATIADRFIGTGSHEYVLQADRGQTITVTAKDGPFPTVIAPNGQPLVDDSHSNGRTSWSGTLPTSGNYKITQESNFRGYDYSFVVEVR